MNNKLMLIVALVILVGAGLFLATKQKAPPPATIPVGETETEEVTIPEETSTFAPVGQEEPEAIAENGAEKAFTVEGANYSFSVKEMRVKKGDSVKVTFVNKEDFHDWIVEGYDNARTKQLQAGAQETVEFVADIAGTFEYYCSVGQHRANGMIGKLIVEE